MAMQADDPVVARMLPLRERCRPAECQRKGLCWVRTPFEAIEPNSGNYAPRCVTCHGKIRYARPDEIGEFATAP